MFTQIFLGLLALIWAGVDFFSIWFWKSDPLCQRIKDSRALRSFRTKRGLLYCAAAILFIAMSFIQKYGCLTTPLFILLYILMGGVLVGAILLLNLKYLDHWR